MPERRYDHRWPHLRERERHVLPNDSLKQTKKAAQQQSVKLLFHIKRFGHFAAIYFLAFLQLQFLCNLALIFEFKPTLLIFYYIYLTQIPNCIIDQSELNLCNKI